MSEWRIGGWRNRDRDGSQRPDPMRVCERPMYPPHLNLPDEEHGYVWGDPIDLP